MIDLDLSDLLDDELYHQNTDHISASGLKQLSRAPIYYWDKYLNPNREERTETDALRVGKAVHCAALEPKKFSERYICLPEDINLRTNAGKATRDEAIASGKIPLKFEEYNRVAMIAATMQTHESWPAWFTGGHAEYLITWVDEETGVKCKMRADYLLTPDQGALIGLPQGIIPDLKTCVDLRRFRGDAWKLGYHIQAAFYRRGYMAEFGCSMPPVFAFGAWEKESPFVGRVFPCGERFMSAGDEEVSKLLRIYAECLETDKWPAPDGLEFLEPPEWTGR